MDDRFDIFEKRRLENPQGVIDDLLKQISRQAKTICDQRKELEETKEKPKEERPKKKRGRQKLFNNS